MSTVLAEIDHPAIVCNSGFDNSALAWDTFTHRLWNLWQLMKVFQSRDFHVISESLTQYENECRTLQKAAGSTVAKPNDALLSGIIGILNQAAEFCDLMRFDAAQEKISLINVYLENHADEADCSSLAAELRNASEAIMAAFWNVKLILVNPSRAAYVENELLLGIAVRDAFKSAIPDIIDAGNSLAVDLGTATVFHLMRVVESGLRALCVHVGVTRTVRSKKSGKTKYKPLAWSEWETMLSALQIRVDAKIGKLAAGKKKQETQEFYYPLLQELRAFKESFRNHVSHARSVYNAREAEAVFEHVKRFMSLLATKVSE